MSRYIEEEAIIKAIDESGQRYGITTANQCNFKEIVRKNTAADVVKVVRCKDCKYGNFLIQDGQEIVSCTNEAPPFADYFCAPMRLDDFCSYGERKEQT